MADSTLSLGMLTARAFWTTRRSIGLLTGSDPPALTAMVISLPIRANCFAIRSQRANIVCCLVSKMRPMAGNLARGPGWSKADPLFELETGAAEGRQEVVEPGEQVVPPLVPAFGAAVDDV